MWFYAYDLSNNYNLDLNPGLFFLIFRKLEWYQAPPYTNTTSTTPLEKSHG